MTMRQWSIVAILFFLNAFIFTILFMLLRQVYLTPPEVAVATPTPTRTPTFAPLPTDTPTPLLAPTPTNTRVVPPTTPTPTFTPTFTPAPPTPTFTPMPPTPTSPPTATPLPPTPTNTPTFTPIPTPTPPYEYRTANVGCYHSGDKFIEGTVWEGGAPNNEVTVRLSWEPDGPAAADYVTGTNADRPGMYFHFRATGDTGTYYVWVVDASGKRISDIGTIQFNNEGPDSPTACWRGVVDFVRNL